MTATIARTIKQAVAELANMYGDSEIEAYPMFRPEGHSDDLVRRRRSADVTDRGGGESRLISISA